METTAPEITTERLAQLRALALCGNALALDVLLAHREDEATRRLCENIRKELEAWEAVRRPRTEPQSDEHFARLFLARGD